MYTTETICVFIYQYCKRSTTYIISNGTNREADVLPPFCNMSVSANASAPVACEGHGGESCLVSPGEAAAEARRWLHADWSTHLSDMIVRNASTMEHLYPYNVNLSEEMNLLFISGRAAYEEIMEDFRRNGQDSEYCPDSDSEHPGGCFRGPGSRTRLRNGIHGLGLRRGSCAPPPPPPPPSSGGLVLRGGLPQHMSASAYAAFALSLVPQSSAAAASIAGNGTMCCAFCRKNGETLAFYSGHMLKDAKGRVTCPILRAYTCPYCGANGDKAHTVKYCPVNATAEAAMVALSREDPSRASTSPCRSAPESAAPCDIGRRRRYRRSH